MGKGQDKKGDKKPAKKKAEAGGSGLANAPAAASKPKVAKAVTTKVKKVAVEAAANPVVTEIVAATLVAAAAAIKNPQKARAIAACAADELEEAGKDAAAKTGPLWQLALEIARRSVEALGEEPAKAVKAGKKPSKKKKKD